MIINSPMMQRCAELKINELNIKSEEYNFNFEYTYTKDNSISEIKIVINNLGKSIENEIKKGQDATFAFGYNNELSYFLSGEVKSIHVKTVNGINRVANIIISEVKNIDKLYKTISKSYAPGITAKAVILDLALAAGLNISTMDLQRNIVYATGIQRYGTPLAELRKTIASCGSFMQIDGNNLHVLHDKTVIALNHVVLAYSSGLLDEPEKCEDKDKKYDYVIKSIAIPDIKPNSVVMINSNDYNGFVKVLEMTISEWKTTYKVEVIA